MLESVSALGRTHETFQHTFEELLACVLLEEGFMCNRSVKIVDHQLKDGRYFVFSIARIMSESSVLSRSATRDNV